MRGHHHTAQYLLFFISEEDSVNALRWAKGQSANHRPHGGWFLWLIR